MARCIRAGLRCSDKTDEVEYGVMLQDGRVVHSQAELVDLIEQQRLWIEEHGRKWKYDEGLQALGVDPSWLCDGWILSLITQFLFYRHAPHLAYPGEYGAQPHIWVEACLILDGVFGVSL